MPCAVALFSVLVFFNDLSNDANNHKTGNVFWEKWNFLELACFRQRKWSESTIESRINQRNDDDRWNYFVNVM